jgi:hypothetical protein
VAGLRCLAIGFGCRKVSGDRSDTPARTFRWAKRSGKIPPYQSSNLIPN